MLPRITITEVEGLPRGWFNGAALERPDGGYLLVVRDQGDALHGGLLDERFHVASAFAPLGLSGNIDPRLTRWDGRAYMSTRYYGEWEYWRIELWPLTECALIDQHDKHWKHTRFMMVEGWPGYTRRRENNWAPFVATDGELHYVHSYEPHRVLWFDRGARVVRKVTEEQTGGPRWPQPGLCEMRLNTNPVRLPDGTLLSTMHAKNYDSNCYYTGFYRFEGEKPYRVLTASPEPAILPHHGVGPTDLRPYAQHATFPLSMHLRGDDLTLIGGSRDATQVVIRTHLEDVLRSLMILA